MPKGRLTIHAFENSSGIAYATVIFARVESKDKISVLLVSARSRIAPKATTIPRLELLAASITTKLARSVVKSFTRKVERFIYWSDSTTMLAWLKRVGDWGTFVPNMVMKIRSPTEINNWNYVSGECNTADLPSQGCTPIQLIEREWWLGPEWLRKSER